jgi:hypothetical protein
MSKLSRILDKVYDGNSQTVAVTHAEEQIKALILEVVEECDPSSKVRDPRTAYWGNVLRRKVKEL